ncbi:MrpF/PhaF family protein [Streptomyces sp. V3I7]|uniref:MrpF/PhaF family protein n=1 Tax=Streptomyces sp. V3I7 TaxID=3042278 RepID=UPI00277E9CEA|nr:MrpF/PhaF family protein [Streptomyces sp. V3I7]MDQ0993793.1 multisubunit Na+/H+ antiporter MnhF subunit [Streptomyces sp. V3I7]
MTSWPWSVAALFLLVVGLGPAVRGVATGPLRRRVVAQNTATLVVCLVFLLLAQGYGRTSYVDLALVLAVLGPAGTLVYARLLAADLERDPPRTRGGVLAAVALTVLVVIPLCVVTGPGRAMAKLLVVGALLITGNVVASRALGGRQPKEPEKQKEPEEPEHG